MSDGIAVSVVRERTTLPLLQVALASAAVLVVAGIVAAALLLSRAQNEREAIRQQALTAAIALSFAFDQEVAAGNALLRGLSSSPALKAGNTRAFYDQLLATPIPEGSWLILSDMEGQLANTARPFGSPLPRHRDFPTYPEALNRVRERGWTVSGRMASIVRPGTTVIALGLRIDHADGSMKGFISTIMSQERLGAILDGKGAAPEWTLGLYDRKLQPIVTARNRVVSSTIPLPNAVADRVATETGAQRAQGFVDTVDERDIPVAVAYRWSEATDWITAISVPRAILDAPIVGASWQILQMAAFLLFAGGAAYQFTARKLEQPLRSLSDQVTGARNELNALSARLLVVQEEERQRIARELHDSTAQHLVAASLALATLEAQVRHSAAGLKVVADVDALLNEALRELRIFTYLLHPPNLATDGLQATLRDFAEGFAGRVGLAAHVRIPEEVDELPPDLQRTILRVVQEALTNVHRHAGASQVRIDARIRSGWLLIRIRDDGRGMVDPLRPEQSIRLGVGIGGMRARLEQFGGDLRIKTGVGGTSIVAVVPLAVAAGTLAPSRRILPSWARRSASTRDGIVL